jgi:hypothetical protein
MLTTLFNSSAVIAISIAVVAFLNYSLAQIALRDESRQRLLIRVGAESDVSGGRRRPPVELIQSFGMATIVILLNFFVDPVTREALAGGFFVMQIASLTMNLDGALRMRALLRPAAADGQILFSKAYQHRSLGARLIGMAMFCGVVALLFSNLAFGAGCAFLFATAIGWYRRARQSSRAVATG